MAKYRVSDGTSSVDCSNFNAAVRVIRDWFADGMFLAHDERGHLHKISWVRHAVEDALRTGGICDMIDADVGDEEDDLHLLMGYACDVVHAVAVAEAERSFVRSPSISYRDHLEAAHNAWGELTVERVDPEPIVEWDVPAILGTYRDSGTYASDHLVLTEVEGDFVHHPAENSGHMFVLVAVRHVGGERTEASEQRCRALEMALESLGYRRDRHASPAVDVASLPSLPEGCNVWERWQMHEYTQDWYDDVPATELDLGVPVIVHHPHPLRRHLGVVIRRSLDFPGEDGWVVAVPGGRAPFPVLEKNLRVNLHTRLGQAHVLARLKAVYRASAGPEVSNYTLSQWLGRWGDGLLTAEDLYAMAVTLAEEQEVAKDTRPVVTE